MKFAQNLALRKLTFVWGHLFNFVVDAEDKFAEIVNFPLEGILMSNTMFLPANGIRMLDVAV